MALTITIDAVDKSSLVRYSTISISQELHTRTLAKFDLVSESSSLSFYRPLVGEVVKITFNGDLIFAGTIERIQEMREKGLIDVLYMQIECVSWEQILDRHLVAKAYDTQTLHDIVEDIRADELSGEAITKADVQTGPTLSKAVFNYSSVTEVFNELAEVSGWEWWIDVDKGLHFVPEGTSTAPMDLDSDNLYLDLTVTRERGDYRNVQYVRAGLDVTDERTETFVGDGENITFNTAYPVASITSIKVDAVAQTFGIRGVEAEGEKEWYYQLDNTQITQDQNETVLDTNILEVVYTGYFPLLIFTNDSAEIAARAAIEGGTGEYEAVEDREEIKVAAFAYDLANGLLRRKGIIPNVINFRTTEVGFRAGQLLTIDLPAYDLDGDYLISRVEFDEIGTNPVEFAYQIECLDGEALGGWAEFWMGLAKKGRRFTIRENEVAGPLIYNTEPIDIAVTFTEAQDSTPCCTIDVDEWGWSEVCA